MSEKKKDYVAPQVEDFDLFSMAFSSAAIGMALVATDGRFLNVNDAMCRITGYSRGELLECNFQSITHPEDLDADIEHAQQLLNGERKSYQMEKRYVRKDGSIAWVLLTGSLARRPSGEPRVFVVHIQDMGAQKQAESELTSFFALCTDLLAIATPDAVLQRVNPAWQTVLGWSTAELEGMSISDLLHPDDVARTAAEFQRIARQGKADARWVNRYRHKDGHYRWLEWTTNLRADGCFLGAARDVTEQRVNDEKTRHQSRQLRRSNRQLSRTLTELKHVNSELEVVRQELESLAWYDSLTGLGNRNRFLTQLDHTIAVSTRKQEEFALLFIDLDGFKSVNDTLGHAAGDVVLQKVANRLRQATRKADLVYRLGGDEFAVMLVPATDAGDGARAVAEKILLAFEHPVRVKAIEFRISLSIGIAFFPQHGQNADVLVRRADAAMYRGKRGKQSITIASDRAASGRMRNLLGRLKRP